MPAPYEGGCLCGAIRYRVKDEPLAVYACHCTDCQRHGGSSFGLSMIVLRDAFELLSGEPTSYATGQPGGRLRHGAACPQCFTRLWGEPANFPQVIVIRPGTLDDTSWLRPIGHIWTRSAQPWVHIPDDALAFEMQPDDYMGLIRAYQARERANPR